MIDIKTILAGVGAGITFSLSAWGKKKNQKFEFKKFGTTVAVGAVCGIGMALINIPLETSHEFLISMGIVPLIENLLKIIKRKIIDRMKIL